MRRVPELASAKKSSAMRPVVFGGREPIVWLPDVIMEVILPALPLETLWR
jgi:hypothetical protein